MSGSIAARVMAWQRHMGGSAGPLSASGEASNGEPVQIEMLISGSWTDITGYVMVRDNSGNISITRGRRDEGSSADHAVMQLLLDNRDGRFSPRNPSGAYYGLIGRNTPIRVSVPNGMGGKGYRFWGEVTAWPVGWDTTGTDVFVELEASGIIRRLAQAPPPSRSVIYNGITDPQITGLIGYWPCEDPVDSTKLASAITNGSAMTFTGNPVLATYEGFGASDPLPTLTGASLTGGIALYDTTSITQHQFRYLLAVPVNGFSNLDVLSRMQVAEVAAGASLLNYFDIHFNDPPGGVGSFGGPGTLTLQALDGDEATFGSAASISLDVRGRLLRVSLETSLSGTTMTCTLRVMDIETGITDSAAMTLTSTSISRVKSVGLAPDTLAGDAGVIEAAVGHVTVQTTITAIDDLGRALQPNGEKAGQRIQRLCGEEGIAFDAIGDLTDSVALGGQSRLNALELIREAELADGGMLYENLAVLGLGYRTRTALLNQDAQLTLNYTGFNLSEIPKPVEDDRYVQNKVTVTVAGVSQTYELTEGRLSTQLPPAGAGIYGEDVTLNLESKNDALDQAAWRVHLGTVDEPRYPQISVNLAHSSFVNNPALKQAVLGLRQGDRILVQNPPSWLPPGDIDQLILGFEEQITHFEHRVTFICAPASPYTVGVLDDADARIDTDGSELAADAASSATTLSVATTSGPLWTADPADAPFDLRIGGEVVTATVVGQVLNTNPDFETDLSAWGPTNGTLTRTDGAAKFGTWSGLLTSGAGADPRAESGQWPVTAGAQYRASAWLHAPQPLPLGVQVLTYWFDAGAAFISATDADSGVPTTGAWESWSGIVTAPVNAVTASVLFQITGTPGAGFELYGDRVTLVPVTSYSTSPQTLTVTRSVNGVTKAQTVGTDVRLAYPTYLAL